VVGFDGEGVERCRGCGLAEGGEGSEGEQSGDDVANDAHGFVVLLLPRVFAAKMAEYFPTEQR
jgi:hypothetical protein